MTIIAVVLCTMAGGCGKSYSTLWTIPKPLTFYSCAQNGQLSANRMCVLMTFVLVKTPCCAWLSRCSITYNKSLPSETHEWVKWEASDRLRMVMAERVDLSKYRPVKPQLWLGYVIEGSWRIGSCGSGEQLKRFLFVRTSEAGRDSSKGMWRVSTVRMTLLCFEVQACASSCLSDEDDVLTMAGSAHT
jgi:hypothetical protein